MPALTLDDIEEVLSVSSLAASQGVDEHDLPPPLWAPPPLRLDDMWHA